MGNIPELEKRNFETASPKGGSNLMSSEEKAPYFSVRARIADVKQTKDNQGLRRKERTIEVILGNQDAIVITNPKDVLDIKNRNLKAIFLDAFKQTDDVAAERKFYFIDKQQGVVE